MRTFFLKNRLEKVEWVRADSYGRTFQFGEVKGSFTAKYITKKNHFQVSLKLNSLTHYIYVTSQIRRMLDLQANSEVIDSTLHQVTDAHFPFHQGIRLPGVPNIFEAGVRGLWKKESLTSQIDSLQVLVDTLGEPFGEMLLFPSPTKVSQSDLSFLKIPDYLKKNLQQFSSIMENKNIFQDPFGNGFPLDKDVLNFIEIYGKGNPDVFVQEFLHCPGLKDKLPRNFCPQSAKPWKSYLSLQLWMTNELL
jgi:AraC family transcriptional regulator of adaptative response / DNA-3-methyladenine glycosylase II